MCLPVASVEEHAPVALLLLLAHTPTHTVLVLATHGCPLFRLSPAARGHTVHTIHARTLGAEKAAQIGFAPVAGLPRAGRDSDQDRRSQ